MDDLRLFKSQSGEWVTRSSLLEALSGLGASGRDVLYVHTDISSFGQSNPELGRSGLLEALTGILLDLEPGTLLMPTFTFSFCNGEDYDVAKSRTKMGVLNDYFRRLPEAKRSVDPLMSTALIGDKRYLVESVGKKSIGEGCTFDLLHKEPDVLFLFLGVHATKCFTYSHYVEERLGVPYRYDRSFEGFITDASGRRYKDSYELFVRYKGVEPSKDDEFERHTVSKGIMRRSDCGDGPIMCITEREAYDLYASKIKADINYMLDHPYPKELVPEFRADHMVAL
jgi:aminoglycoside 3-N-acetyltransferase